MQSYAKQPARLIFYGFFKYMLIRTLKSNNPIFKAHFYKVLPKDNKIIVQTDNQPYTGLDAHIVSPDFFRGETEKKMEKNNNYFFTEIKTTKPVFRYHIEFKDSGEKDFNNGKDYEVPKDELRRQASLYLRKLHNQPEIHAIKAGEASGKIFYKEIITSKDFETLKDIKEPTIIVTKHFHQGISNPNIVGIIYTADDAGAFSHLSAQLRNRLDVSGAIYRPDIISRLQKLNGQNIQLKLKDNFIEFQKTDNILKPKKFPKIFVPKLKYSNKILTSKEYSPDIIGAKAVNLRRLEKLQETGKIDAIIPKSVALPWGYIENLLTMAENGDDIFQEGNFSSDLENELNNLRLFLKNNGVNKKALMIRSAFNGEDLPDYCAAGIYETDFMILGNDNDNNNFKLLQCINHVAKSKMSYEAVESRKRHEIPDDQIQPGIIIQNMIDADCKFTLYTDDGSGNLKIDLFTNNAQPNGAIQPHVFTYHRDCAKLTYDSIQMDNDAAVLFDENKKIIKADPVKCNLSQNQKLFKLLEKLSRNAIEIEKEFGHPQDIEGGIKDDMIYLWQSRNIVDP